MRFGRSSPTAFVVVCALASASCQALPPPARVDAREGVVRAGSPEEAAVVAKALDALLPEVLALLPDARARSLEVWIQDEPELYTFPRTSAYRDADGFFSDRLDRIHLRSSADDLRRTLAHELVHASLGDSWKGLPGTIEEGLCDVVAIELCPESAARLRAGRLLAAALELGGFDLESSEPAADRSSSGDPAADTSAGPRYVQHVFSSGSRVGPIDPMEVFRAHAGRSSASMPGDVKKALYGLAFLVTERIVERRGVAGLHALVARFGPDASGRFVDALLAAADLTRDRDDWRRAIAAALGPHEVAEIARILPGVVVSRTVSLRMPETPPARTAASLDVRCVRP
jgi:hypothetical protein